MSPVYGIFKAMLLKETSKMFYPNMISECCYSAVEAVSVVDCIRGGLYSAVWAVSVVDCGHPGVTTSVPHREGTPGDTGGQEGTPWDRRDRG